MKRVIALSAALALCLSLLSACSGGAKESAAPSEPVESVQPSQEPSEAVESVPAESDPVDESQPVESAPGGSAPAGAVDLAAFVQTVMEDHEFPMMNRADPSDEVGAVMLGNYYPGLVDLDLEQVEVYLAMISFSGGELSLVQAKDADNAAKAKEIFQARVDSQSEEGPNNYPEEVEVWQRNSQIVTNGNYIMLVCHEDCEAIVSAFNALFS